MVERDTINLNRLLSSTSQQAVMYSVCGGDVLYSKTTFRGTWHSRGCLECGLRLLL